MFNAVVFFKSYGKMLTGVIVLLAMKGTITIQRRYTRDLSPSPLGESVVFDRNGNHYLHLNGQRYLPLVGKDIHTLLTLRLVQDS
jgi:hypothetical protein